MRANTAAFYTGQRVETSGQGRTAEWQHLRGTVTRVTRNSVIVRWDGTSFEDEMDPAEVRPLIG
jgi:hypothetical protein